jgi:hypothetical protein
MSVPSNIDGSVSPAAFWLLGDATMPVRIMSDAELTKFEVLRHVDYERMPAR